MPAEEPSMGRTGLPDDAAGRTHVRETLPYRDLSAGRSRPWYACFMILLAASLTASSSAHVLVLIQRRARKVVAKSADKFARAGEAASDRSNSVSSRASGSWISSIRMARLVRSSVSRSDWEKVKIALRIASTNAAGSRCPLLQYIPPGAPHQTTPSPGFVLR